VSPSSALGGTIKVNASAPKGITDSSGTYLDGGDEGVAGDAEVFTISPKAQGVTR
jgi:hypothetical protein